MHVIMFYMHPDFNALHILNPNTVKVRILLEEVGWVSVELK